MWGRMAAESGGGWAVPLGDRRALSDRLIRLAQDRTALNTAAASGLAFARAHGFEAEFSKRMAHFAACLDPKRTVI